MRSTHAQKPTAFCPYLMRTYSPCAATKIVSNAVQKCHDAAIRINNGATGI